MADSDSIPLTVVGGFLGAGKTTLVNRILRGAAGVRYAVLVNDFGEIAVDASLVVEHDGDTMTFANGCLCCTLGDSLMTSLDDLLARPRPPEHIVVETSGVADPAAIADIAVLEPRLRADLVVVLADVETVRERADDELVGDTVARQLRAAGVVVLNRCDLVDGARVASVREWIESNWPVPVVEARHADVALALLEGAFAPGEGRATPTVTGAGHPFRSESIRVDAALEPAALRRRLRDLPASVIRAKGFVPRADGTCYEVQLAGRRVDLRPRAAAAGRGLVFVGTPDMPDAAALLGAISRD